MQNLSRRSIATSLLAAAVVLIAPLHCAVGAPTKSLVDLTVPGAESRFTPSGGSNGQVTITAVPDKAAPGVVVNIAPGSAGWPAAVLKPADGTPWDLSAYDHIDVKLVNMGQARLFATVRIDNAGNWQDNPWNAEMADLQPGQGTTVHVMFGRSYGHKPGFKLNPAAVTQVMLMTGKTDIPEAIRIVSIDAVAGGLDIPAPSAPAPPDVRIAPAGGVMLGGAAPFDPAVQLMQSGAVVKYDPSGNSLEAAFSSQGSANAFSIKPLKGMWDLGNTTQVRVKLTNSGTQPAMPYVQLVSKEGNSIVFATSAPIAPGATTEIVAPFAAKTSFVGTFNSETKQSRPVDGTGTKFVSHAVTSIKIGLTQPADTKIVVQSVLADAPSVEVPAWLGRRPPVEGAWVKTFDESFTSPVIDKSRWNIAGINPWDKATHFSKDNLVLSPGSATLHFEKKTGYHNDDPAQSLLHNADSAHSTDYVCGYLDSSQKWKQRYGYFEAKLKLPTAPGLWPAFWMMPDGWDIGNNGMEFDIMEHLDRWGPHRYNIAMHWDGYGQNHKALGYGNVYAAHDKSGFMTVGLLWTPGSAIYYCNGTEVARWENARISSVPSFFIVEMTTGGWDNDPVDDSKLPADFTLQYVRAWQRADLASPLDSPPSLSK
ncbi:MAG TPA: glycoside hydrolase family 16 protein [Capsulimonadaceae bacterium]